MSALLDEFTKKFRTPLWVDDPHFTSLRRQTDVTSAVVDGIVSELGRELRRRRVGRALNWLALGLRLTPERFIALVRRNGHLRPSKYEFDGAIVQTVLTRGLESRHLLDIDPAVVEYMSTMTRLSIVSTDIAQRRQKLLGFLRVNKVVAFKGFLALVDMLFMGDWTSDRRKRPDDLLFYTKEEVAEGVSLICRTFCDHVERPGERSLEGVDAEAIERGAYFPHLVTACTIRAFQEWEILIDVLDYTLTGDGARYFLSPSDVEFGKSFHLGFIQTDRIMASNATTLRNPGLIDLRQMAEQLARTGKWNLLDHRTQPVEYFALRLPNQADAWSAISDKEYFYQEEMISLHEASAQFLMPVTDILAARIHGAATIHDLIIVHRMVQFLSCCMRELLRQHGSSRTVVLRSLLPQFATGELEKMLSLVVSPEVAHSVLELLTWRPESMRIFDLQYQSILGVGDKTTVASNVLAGSNVVRNSLQLSRKRLSADHSDPLAERLGEALRGKGFVVRVLAKYRWQGSEGEIDVFACRENQAFAFECKNALHPCSVHEARTSLDHVLTGSEQLTRFQRLWADTAFQETFLVPLGGVRVEALWTCIVTGNRIFDGYAIDGHAVRASAELLGFLEEARVVHDKQVRCLWTGPEFEAKDLALFLSREHLFYRCLFDSLMPTLEEWNLGACSVARQTFVLDLLQASEQMGFDVSRERRMT